MTKAKQVGQVLTSMREEIFTQEDLDAAYDRGYRDGTADGYDAGYLDGKDDGFGQGYNEGSR